MRLREVKQSAQTQQVHVKTSIETLCFGFKPGILSTTLPCLLGRRNPNTPHVFFNDRERCSGDIAKWIKQVM